MHTIDHICVYDTNFTNYANNETVDLTISDKIMGLFELNKKLTVARGYGLIFNQLIIFKIKNYGNLSNISIHYYLKLRIPIMHCHFFMKL